MKTPTYFFSSKTTSVLFGCALATLIGCSTLTDEAQDLSSDAKATVIAPAPNTTFTPDAQRKTKLAYLPFQKAWIKPGFDKGFCNWC
ncbi:MAG: hypothetical protein PHD43_18665 [Methylococcales bacterium]|nr:hypothetical protein [Methylococcales bacterium]